MIAFLRLLDLFQVGVEILLREEGGAVETLQLFAVGIVLPVSAGNRQQLESTHFAGVRNVRSAAEVDELPLTIKTEARMTEIVDVLDLVLLTQILNERAGLAERLLEALEPLGLLDDLRHLSLDSRKVLLANRSRRVDVVVKAVLDGRPKGQLSARKQAHDRTSHDVSARMAQHVEGLAILVGQDGDGVFARGNLAIKVKDGVVNLGGNGGLGQALADRLGDLAGAGAVGILSCGAIRKAEGEHERKSPEGKTCGTPLRLGAATQSTRQTGTAFARRGSRLI